MSFFKQQPKLTRPIDYQTYDPLLGCFVSLAQEVLGDQVVSIVLYGSVARGEANTRSDIDLLLVLEKTSPVYRERLRTLFPVLRRLKQQSCWKELELEHITPSLSVVIFSREEADQNRLLYLDMIEEAHVLVDRGGFFRNRLATLHSRLQELGAQKIQRPVCLH